MQVHNRLRKSSDFARVRRGRSTGSPLLVLTAIRTEGTVVRCGFVASKRVGSAVARNRVKRRLREIMRRLLPTLPGGWDLVLAGRPAAASASFPELADAVTDVLRRARVRVAEPPPGARPADTPPVPSVASPSPEAPAAPVARAGTSGRYY
jgi:ribonuclease P protein component